MPQMRRLGSLSPLRLLKKMRRSTAVKLGGIALAVLVIFLPLLFWPAEDDLAAAGEQTQTVITVPPVAVVPSVLADSSSSASVSPQAATPTTEPPIDITVAAVGDITIHESILASAYDAQSGAYDFTSIFAPVAPYLASADYALCNLESRLAGGSVSGGGSWLFDAPPSLADALTSVGFDLVATANNHSADYGWLGITRTLDRLDQAGLAHVGTYRSAEDKSTPRVVDIQGIKVAFLDYTDFLNTPDYIAGREAYAVNMLDVDTVAAEAAAAREQGAEVVIAILHYGMEYRRTPTSRQTKVSEGSFGAEGLLSRGVDVILGSHSHMVQPIVKVVQYALDEGKDTYAVYSLGNFLTGQRWRYTDSGIIAYVHILKQGEDTRVTGISYLPVYVQKSGEEEVTYRILPVLPRLTPVTDVAISAEDQGRINQVWDELNRLLYRPDEGIFPLSPREDLSLEEEAV